MLNILYLCTHNRCRSILSEAITRDNADDVITARSAGSSPATQVHPLTLKYLAETGYSTAGLYSKSWDSLYPFKPDVVISLCDPAKGACPVWLSGVPQLHWGLADPSTITSGEADQAIGFVAAITQIERRVERLRAIAELPKSEQLDALLSMSLDD